jgi:uncharacterized protein (DUF4415 family)
VAAMPLNFIFTLKIITMPAQDQRLFNRRRKGSKNKVVKNNQQVTLSIDADVLKAAKAKFPRKLSAKLEDFLRAITYVSKIQG